MSWADDTAMLADAMIDQDHGFGEPVTLPSGTVTGVFDLPGGESISRARGSDVGSRMHIGQQAFPLLYLRTSDAAGLREQDTVSVREVAYLVVRLTPDGTGLTEVELMRPGVEPGRGLSGGSGDEGLAMSGKIRQWDLRDMYRASLSAGPPQRWQSGAFGNRADIQGLLRGPHPNAIGIVVDTGAAWAEISRYLDTVSIKSQRAVGRALRKFRRVIRRLALQAAAESSGLTQKYFLQAFRFHAEMERENGELVGVSIWIGTNPIPVHRLGTVRWQRRTTVRKQLIAGASVGKKRYPGAWSWGYGVTGSAVMRRSGQSRLPIERVEVEPHEAVLARLRSMAADLQARFIRLMRQELNYALNVESAR